MIDFRSLLAVASLLVLAACSTPPERPAPQAEVSARTRTTTGFNLTARFALRQELNDAPPKSLAGRMDWTHTPEADRILLADPLSRGLAELERKDTGARLTLADGRSFAAANAESLLRDTTGFTLPLRQLADWLCSGKATRLDAQGRAEQLIEGDWAMDTSYDGDEADAPPARVTLRYLGAGDLAGLEVRLRIESWSTTP